MSCCLGFDPAALSRRSLGSRSGNQTFEHIRMRSNNTLPEYADTQTHVENRTHCSLPK